MYSEEQSKFWEELKKHLSDSEVETIQKYVSLYDMFTNSEKYKAIQKAVCKQLLKGGE